MFEHVYVVIVACSCHVSDMLALFVQYFRARGCDVMYINSITERVASNLMVNTRDQKFILTNGILVVHTFSLYSYI